MDGSSCRLEQAICLRDVPSPHEDDRLSRPNREAVWCANDHTKLEHNPCSGEDFEKAGRSSKSLIQPLNPPPQISDANPFHQLADTSTVRTQQTCLRAYHSKLLVDRTELSTE